VACLPCGASRANWPRGVSYVSLLFKPMKKSKNRCNFLQHHIVVSCDLIIQERERERLTVSSDCRCIIGVHSCNKWHQSPRLRSRDLRHVAGLTGGRGSSQGRRDQSPSPPPCQPRHRDGRHEVIVERVVEKSTVAIVYPMLMRTNYMEWSAVMHVNLEAAGLWEAVRYGGVEYHNDRHALAAQLCAVPADM
jgi:hypothetical protein